MPFPSSPGFNFGGKVPPTPYYPAGSVIPFYGPTPATMPTGWVRWAGADGGHVLIGAQSSIAPVEIQSAYSPATIQAVSGYSIGSHTYESGKIFTTIYHNTQTGSAGPVSSYLTGGSHSHSGGSFNYSGAITPNTITVNFLRSTEITYELPVDSVIFKGTTPTKASSSSITNLGPSRYITGSSTVAPGTLTNGNSTQFAEWVTGTAGSHYHSPGNTRARGLAGGGYNYDTAYGGTHFHSLSRTITQSIFGTTTLLRAWQLLTTLVPESGMIIMYLGSISALKAPWYVCDGTKGTINLQNRYVAMTDGSNVHGVEVTGNIVYGLETVGTSNSNAYHSHQGSYLNYKGSTPASASHISQYWYHDHSFSTQTNSGANPPRVTLHFIQFKG